MLAINSVPIRNERQASRLLSGTAGDLLVLIERDLRYYIEDDSDGIDNGLLQNGHLRDEDDVDYEDDEVMIATEEFLCINSITKKPKALLKTNLKGLGKTTIAMDVKLPKSDTVYECGHIKEGIKESKVVEGLVEQPAKSSCKSANYYLYIFGI